jgi:MinD superfamily P-loop ATPase
LIPYDKTITKAMVEGKNVIEFDKNSEVSKAIIKIYEKMEV